MKQEQAFRLVAKVTTNHWNSRLKNLEEIIVLANTMLTDRNKRKNYFPTESLQLSNLLVQKILLHGSTILFNADGINFPSKYKYDLKIKDPLTLNVIFRSLLESYLTLNHLNFSKIEDENEVRFKIWIQFGLRQRAKMTFSELEEKGKQLLNSEKYEIDNLVNEIQSSIYYTALDNEKKESFTKQISRDWKFGFKGSTYLKFSWQELLNNSGVNKKLFCDTYNFLSWFAHSTCISLYQLRDMYIENNEDIEVNSIIKDTAIFIALAITDCIKIDEELKFQFDNLNQEDKDLINIYNCFFRDESYAIDFIKE